MASGAFCFLVTARFDCNRVFKLLYNLTMISRIFGGLIGFVIGIILSYAFFYATSNYVPAFADDVAQSKLANFVLNIGQLF